MFFFFPSSVDAFGLPKVVLFYAVTCSIGTFMVLSCQFRGLTHRHEYVYCLLLLLISQTLTFLYSDAQQVAMFGMSYRYLGYATYIAGLLYAFILYRFWQYFSPATSYRLFCVVFVGMSSASLLFAIMTNYISEHVFPIFAPSQLNNRIFGTFGDPNTLGLMAIVSAVLAQSLRGFYFRVGAISIAVLAIVLSGSKVAVLIGVFYLFFGIYKNFGYLFAGASCFVFIVIAVLLSPRLLTTWGMSESVSERVALYGTVVSHIADIPIFGFGQDTQSLVLQRWDQEAIHPGALIDRFHSEFAEVLVTRGWFGILVVFFVNLLTYIRAWQQKMYHAVFSLLAIHLAISVHFHTITTYMCAVALTTLIHSMYSQENTRVV